MYVESTGIFGGRNFTKSPVRATLVVFHSPAFYNSDCILQRFKPMGVQTFISERPVERFNVRVVRRLAGTAVVNAHAVLITPRDRRLGW